ncbi:hypothetical protein [Acanthopleuribacter pedis]|uniref:Uncharacterized protein n=1 Tax=Acanthopleuribacter pedis TaxID=442870 RepID=A0A8J7U3C9_9BACT|nr:hypothetical protein [Acanthopleuribacter pedis]MBO1320253.1 hypothetical protein [Acanthopleuribacter pedis]
MVFSWFKKKPRRKQKPAALMPRPKDEIRPEDLEPIRGHDRREDLAKMGGAEEVATIIRGMLAEDRDKK